MIIIIRCTAREKKGKEVYACYTVDGLNKVKTVTFSGPYNRL